MAALDKSTAVAFPYSASMALATGGFALTINANHTSVDVYVDDGTNSTFKFAIPTGGTDCVAPSQTWVRVWERSAIMPLNSHNLTITLKSISGTPTCYVRGN